MRSSMCRTLAALLCCMLVGVTPLAAQGLDLLDQQAEGDGSRSETVTGTRAVATQDHGVEPVVLLSLASARALASSAAAMNEKPIQSGTASYYGKGDSFHGKKTASGEIFDRNKMTAAHRKLKLGTFVRVENPANGKSVVVKINDRGPYHGNRIIDLSWAAARELGYVEQGIARVNVYRVR
jgi:rare lipoprotein A